MSELRQLARGVPGAEWRRIIDVPAPGAGTSVVVHVPGAKAWRLLSVIGTFATSAAVGARVPAVTLGNPTDGPWGIFPFDGSVAPSKTVIATWAAGLGYALEPSNGPFAFPLPSTCYLMAGDTLTLAGVADAGDQWSKVRVVVIETNTGDTIHGRNIEQAIVDHARALYDLTH